MFLLRYFFSNSSFANWQANERTNGRVAQWAKKKLAEFLGENENGWKKKCARLEKIEMNAKLLLNLNIVLFFTSGCIWK